MEFIITYDLRKPGEDYEELLGALREKGAIHVQKSVWFLAGSYTSSQLRDHFIDFIDSNDRLLVASIDDWSSFNLIASIPKS